MKNKTKILSLCLAALMVLTLLSACGQENKGDQATSASQTSAEATPKEEPLKDVKLTYLYCWVGGTASAPEDLFNNTVAKVIKEKTGVTLDFQYITTPGNEKLNLIFASGEIPDIVNAPYWGGADVNTQIIKKAATEGLLLPLDELIEKYGPNVKPALTEGVAKDFRENDLEDPAFGGKHYLIPWQNPKSEEDNTNWGVANFIRKDILEALGAKAEDFKTSEDLYGLIKRIKAGNFKDINGKSVIPAGTWANGWSYVPLINSFTDNNLAGFSLVDGKYRLAVFSPNMDKQVLFMRKLVSEGLYDVEAFRQNDTVAMEKMTTGRVAMVGAHYFYMKNRLQPTLYTTHPEMEYVPIVVQDANGENLQIAHKIMKGRAGCPVMFFGKDNKDPEASMKVLNYINSEEGKMLVNYGIEGTHFTLVDGKPRFTAEWLDNWNKDQKLLINEGIRATYVNLVLLDDRQSNYGELQPGDATKKDEAYEKIKAMAPLKIVDGYRMSYFKSQYPKAADIDALTAQNTYTDAIEKAYFAKTDDAALKILNDYRQQLIKGGIEDYEKFINEKAATRNDVLN